MRIGEGAGPPARSTGRHRTWSTSHAIRVAIDLALEAWEAGEKRATLFDLCGHGHFDPAAYEQYLADELVDLEHSE